MVDEALGLKGDRKALKGRHGGVKKQCVGVIEQ